MLVYGDPWRTLDLAHWRERAGAPLPAGGWIVRHGDLAARLIEAGQILQALEDDAFAAAGSQDRDDPDLRPMKRYLVALADALIQSFREERACLPTEPPPALPPGSPDALKAREPEGYGFYALYPEAYAAAARSMGAGPDTLVIGLRSIGASLGPVVAAALGAPLFTTLRPKGPPFARDIAAPDLEAALAARPPRHVAIVDEGPGLSGSSFASVAHFVRRHAPGSQIAFLPSHAGSPGPQASAQTRRLFATIPRHVGCFDHELRARLPGWVADLTGPQLAPLEDLSGGAWRRLAYRSEADWPPADPGQERLKFLLRTTRGKFLLKFVGLGEIGARKARLAAALGDARLAPEALGFRHGFFVERWRDDARPVDPARDRAVLLPALARYLAFRQKHFACDAEAYGADADELRRMAARNTSLALDDSAASQAAARLAPLMAHARRIRKIMTDNRMHAHEWLATAEGCVLKTDGVDHHAGHDLIGAQDIAYDIAAASVEFAMTPCETRQLCHAIGIDSGVDLVAPYRIVWLTFEIGRAVMAQSACAATPEAQRLDQRRRTLTEKLKHELALPFSSQNRELQRGTVVWPT